MRVASPAPRNEVKGSGARAQRVTAWYGIRLTRDLNSNDLDPLAGVFPVDRLGPTGDVPQLDCAPATRAFTSRRTWRVR